MLDGNKHERDIAAALVIKRLEYMTEHFLPCKLLWNMDGGT